MLDIKEIAESLTDLADRIKELVVENESLREANIYNLDLIRSKQQRLFEVEAAFYAACKVGKFEGALIWRDRKEDRKSTRLNSSH